MFNIKQRVVATLFMCLCSVFAAQAQGGFNDYKPLKSYGSIPEKFTLTLEERIELTKKNKYKGKNTNLSNEFIRNQAVAEQRFLNSGLVVYGDSLSQYVSELAKKILRKNKSLYKDLDFYILKTNECNAFMSGIGVMYITTGLLSQMSSESDLAFVIAHEAAHYELQHSLNFHIESKENKGVSFKNVAHYNKQQEYEADSLGLYYFLKAGYDYKSVDITFDMLYFSYLPIDEINVKDEFLFGENSAISLMLKSDKVRDIEYNQDYDDEYSSHPNIKKRKDRIVEIYEDQYKNLKGKNQYLLGKDRFHYVRNLARFERVQNFLYTAEYANCVYEINVLLEQYPNNKYLEIAKAIAFTNAAVAKVEGIEFIDYSTLDDHIQGSIYDVHYFFEKCRDKELLTYALRNVSNIKKKYPHEEVLTTMENSLFKLMVTEGLELNDYNKLSIDEVLAEKEKRSEDSSFTKESTEFYGYTAEEWASFSKYKKIKIKREKMGDSEFSDVDNEIDSSKIYLYAIADLARDEEYLSRFNEMEEWVDKNEKYTESKGLPYEQMKLNYENYSDVDLEGENIFFTAPTVLHFKKKGLNFKKSERNRKIVNRAFENESSANSDFVKLSSTNSDFSTLDYNTKAALGRYRSIRQYIGNSSYFNPDYQFFHAVSKDYDSKYMMVSTLISNYDMGVNLFTVGYSVILYGAPLIPYLGSRAMKGKRNRHQFLLIDLNTGEIVKKGEYYYSQRLTAASIRLYLNDFLNN